MKKFTIYWDCGKSEILQGKSIQVALDVAGYSTNDLLSISFYTPGDTQDSYIWDSYLQKWKSKN